MYQGYRREQLAINAEIFPEANVISFLIIYVLRIFNFAVSTDLNISTGNSRDMTFGCKITENSRSNNVLCTHKALTFPTCSSALSFSNLLPVVFSVLSWWLHSRHLVFWLMRRKSSWLNNWKSSS